MKLEEGYFQGHDGIKLFYRAWLSENLDHPVILLHGLHEHSGRYGRIVEKLNLPQFSYFSYDQRGHGKSEGKQGYAENLDQFVKDIDAFRNFLLSKYPEIKANRIVWYGHSFGGLWLSRYAAYHPENVSAIVMSSPCFGIRSWVSHLDHLIASFAPLCPDQIIPSFVYRTLLSHDPYERKLHKEDTLIHNKIGIVLLKDSLKKMPDTIAAASSIKQPLLMLVSGSEYVVQKRKSIKFFNLAGSAEKQLYVFPGFYHELLREKKWEMPIKLMRDFLLKYSRD